MLEVTLLTLHSQSSTLAAAPVAPLPLQGLRSTPATASSTACALLVPSDTTLSVRDMALR